MKKLFVILISFLFLGTSVLAIDYPKIPTGYVTDLAAVVSESEKMELEILITQLEKELTVEVAVLILNTLAGEDISQFTFELGEEWWVGKAGNDNGLMVVIAVQDRKWFTATGYGLEGALPDAIVKRMGENSFPQHFRAGDYTGGVKALLVEARRYLEKDPTVIAEYESQPADYYDEEYSGENSDFFIYIIFFLIAWKGVFLGRKKWSEKWLISLISSIAIFFLGAIFVNVVIGIIFAFVSLIFDLPRAWGKKVWGTSTSWSSGSGGWSSGGSSFGGSSFGWFGGGSFGGWGAGGSW